MRIRTMAELWGLGATGATGQVPGATGGATGIMDSKNIQED